MKSTVELKKETILINRVGPYGVLVGETWYGLNEPLTPKNFVAGQAYDVLVKVGAKKSYIAQIVGTTELAGEPIRNVVPVRTETKSVASTQTHQVDYKSEQQDKNTSIKRQGSWQAAIQSYGLAQLATSKDEFLRLVEEAAERGVLFIEKR